MKLLCRDAAYGPYILTGAENLIRRDKEWQVNAYHAYQVVAVVDGSVSYRVKGRKRTPEAPYVLLIQPQQDVTIRLPAGVTWHVLRFDAVFQRRKPVRSAEDSTAPARSFAHYRSTPQPCAKDVWGVDLPLEVPRELASQSVARLRWCNAHWWRGATDYARANAQLGLWLLDLVEAVRAEPHDEDTWLAQLKRFCTDNMVHGVSVTDLANAAGISRQHLRLRLLETCAMGPKEFIDSLRIDEACRHLSSTKRRIDEIANRCGYPSASVFSRRFKKYTGLSPRQWRQRQGLNRS